MDAGGLGFVGWGLLLPLVVINRTLISHLDALGTFCKPGQTHTWDSPAPAVHTLARPPRTHMTKALRIRISTERAVDRLVSLGLQERKWVLAADLGVEALLLRR